MGVLCSFPSSAVFSLMERSALYSSFQKKRAGVDALEFSLRPPFLLLFRSSPWWVAVCCLSDQFAPQQHGKLRQFVNVCVCARACPILYPYALMCKPIHKHASAFGLASMSKYNYSHKNKWIRLVTVHLLCLNTTVINRDPSPLQQHYFLSPSQRQPDRLEAL